MDVTGKGVQQDLNQYAALLSYFMGYPEVEKAGRVKRIFDRLKAPVTKLTLLFLHHILPVWMHSIQSFRLMKPRLGLCCLRWIGSSGSCWSSSSRWSTSRALTCNELLFQTRSCSRTTRPLLWGWLFRQGAAAGRRDHCCGDGFSDRELQQDDETIAVGMAFQTGSCSRTTRPLLWGWLFRQGAAAGRRDHCCGDGCQIVPAWRRPPIPHDSTAFFFLLMWEHSMLLQWGRWSQSSPSRIPFLPDSVVLDPSKKTDLDYAPVVRLADRFVLHVDTELLKKEWDDFGLLDKAAVSMTMVDAKSKQQKLDEVWSDVVSMNTSLGILRFPEMVKVYAALLCLPHSNADCERTFSMVRKTHTQFRKRWDAHWLHGNTPNTWAAANSQKCHHWIQQSSCVGKLLSLVCVCQWRMGD